MIPKKIHYCWLSGEEMPPVLKKCMNTWKTVMPEYELVLWDKKRFDVKSISSLAEACRNKYWAFAADYIRLYALYTEGGIYLDSDVVVRKSFNDFLEYDFFSGIEWHYGLTRKDSTRTLIYREKLPDLIPNTAWVGMQAAIMGAKAGHPFLKDCLDWFKDNEYSIHPAKLNTQEGIFEAIAPEVYATLALKYGFEYKNREQRLSHNMVIFPSSVFASVGTQLCETNYAVHLCASEWRKKSLYAKLAQNKLLRKFLRKKPATTDFFDMFQMFNEIMIGNKTVRHE